MYEVNAYKLTLKRDRETLLYLKPLSQSQNQDFQKYKKPKKRKRFSDSEYVEEKKKPNLLKRLCLKAFCQKASDSGDSDISQPDLGHFKHLSASDARRTRVGRINDGRFKILFS